MALQGYAIYVLPLFAALIALEVLWFRRGHRAYPWRESLISIGVWLGRIATGLLGAGVLAFVYEALWRATPLRIPLDNAWSWALLFVGVEFFYYWFHRCSHEIRWLWATHAVHHSAEEIHLIAAYRLGWTSLLSGSWIFYLPLIAAGFHPTAVLLMIGINLTYQFWLHTVAIDTLPRWFSYVFNTPAHHRVHHAVNPDYLDTNYGGVLILFDRWFGTFAAERAGDPCRYGLVDPITSGNPFVIAFREWWRMGRDVLRAKSWRARFGHAFGPPGWRPDGSGSTTANLRKAARIAAA
ncbi:MAG: sterol desaturase family protein [Rhodospirillaceae bacterium]|nr:sterol desaturase family protein [Rhodospirillaceae bacterium]